MTSSWKIFFKGMESEKNSMRRLKIEGRVSATQYWVPGVEGMGERVG